MNDTHVLIFHTSSSALRAEKVLVRAGLKVKLVPTPREVSSDCGISLRFSGNETERVQQLLTDAHVEIAGMHVWEGGKWI